MSEADDALREMAANRGCRLAKSRRRKPGGDYGRYGLRHAKTGKPVFGFGKDGLTATAAEIEAFLRGGAASSWKSSLGAAGKAAETVRPAGPARPPRPARPARTAKATKAPRPARDKPAPVRKAAADRRVEPDDPGPPAIREARPGDADALARLIVELGYEVAAADVRRRIARLRKAGEPVLVADREGIIGCVSWHVTPVVHRPRPVGRLTMLAVAGPARGGGVGAALVAAAEARLRERGCGLIEVTSNIRRLRAHIFYRKLGFERTSYRFAKVLQD